jgi:hypothetical protein
MKAGVTFAAALGLALSGFSGVAAAQDIGCGAVLAADTTLTADVTECPGTGLVIGAPGITVDLGGHTVSGGFPGGAPDQVGIDDSAGFDGVTIRNGAVHNFERGGVWLAGVDDARVEQLDIELSSEFGVLVDGGSRNVVRDNRMLFPGTSGIAVRGTSRANVVADNRVESQAGGGIALGGGPVADTTIRGNEVTGGLADERPGGGILVGADGSAVTGTRLRGNYVHFNFDRGVLVGAGAGDTTIAANRFADNLYSAIENEAPNTSIRANRFHEEIGLTSVAVWIKEGSSGIDVEGNSMRGIGLAGVDDGGTGTVVRFNAIDGRFGAVSFGTFAGIVLRPESGGARVEYNAVSRQSQDGIVVSGRDALVAENAVSASVYGDGIRVAEDARGATVRANVATRHRDDGIEVLSPGTTVTRNLATDNGDLGIEAVAGTVDGGGNRAAGNGNPAQCTGVVCAPVFGG